MVNNAQSSRCDACHTACAQPGAPAPSEGLTPAASRHAPAAPRRALSAPLARACAQCHPARKTRQEQRRGGARRLLRGDARGRRPRPAAEGLASRGRQKAAQGLRMSLLHLKVRLRRKRVRVHAADVHAPSPPMLPQRALQHLTTRWCSQRLWTRGAAAGCTLSLRTLASPMRVSAMSTPARGVCGCRCTWMRRLQQPPRARSLQVVRPSRTATHWRPTLRCARCYGITSVRALSTACTSSSAMRCPVLWGGRAGAGTHWPRGSAPARVRAGG